MTVTRKEISAEERAKSLRGRRIRSSGLLWHYTSIDVLEHFLQGEIAFTHYKFMNDNQELSYGQDLLVRMSQEEDNEVLKETFINNPFFYNNKSNTPNFNIPILGDTYLFCFSTEGDSPYQWRSYTPNGGVAIAFDCRELYAAVIDGMEKVSSVIKECGYFGLLKCRYTDDVTRRFILRLIKRSEESKKKERGCCGGCGTLGLYYASIIRTLLTQKNPSFHAEKEERLILQGDFRKDIAVIGGKPRIVIKDAGVSQSIKSIRLSPHGDTERNQLLVEILRDKYGLDFTIERSLSSYNGK